MTTTQIFNAYDLTTDNSATLEHRFTPWGSWHVTTYVNGHHREVMHDWLPSAAEAITNALQTFKDDDAPTAEQALETIVAKVGNPHYEVFDSGNGPFILDNEECTDEQETNQCPPMPTSTATTWPEADSATPQTRDTLSNPTPPAAMNPPTCQSSTPTAGLSVTTP